MTVRPDPPPVSVLCERGHVVDVEPGGVWVQIEKPRSCSACSASSGCTTALLSRFSRKASRQVWVSCATPLQRGDAVTLGLPASRFLQGTAIVYGLPLGFALVLGGLADAWSGSATWVVTLAFMLGLALGASGAGWYARHRGSRFVLRLQEDAPSEGNLSTNGRSSF